LAQRHLLVLRFALVNIVAAGLFAAAWLQGWLDGLFEGTTFILSGVVFAVFLYGLTLCGFRVWQTNVALNDMKNGGRAARSRAARYLPAGENGDPERRSLRLDMVRLALSHRIQIVRQIANMLVFLGLIGTVIGFIIALSGVKPETVTQTESVGPMVATLIRGMSVALYTTLLGAVLSVWLNINHRILSTGTVTLMTEIAAFGESGDYGDSV
jgi:hypothetical protein